ncbi:MAG: hypothetical protein ACC646_13050, partial [Paracoccaceae bacterium]
AVQQPDKVPATLENAKNVRIRTVVDRDAAPQLQQSILDDAGIVCLSETVFDVRGWGRSGAMGSPYDNLRSGLVGEFDKPDADAILRLAQRYIALGFGAETKALLSAFDVEIPNADILIAMADIMDLGFSPDPGRLAAQLSCSSGAAMWAVLAGKSIPAGGQVDTKSVLKTFSGLPSPMRQHLGPSLSKRFLDRGDVTTATAFRDLIDRAPGARNSQYGLMQARLSAQAGDTGKSLQELRDVVAGDGPAAPLALVKLIDDSIAAGRPIAVQTARSADALAVEFRGTEMGRRLTRAAIRGFAVTGNVQTTFERIQTALQNDEMTRAEAESLRAEAHVRNAQDSSDAYFLRQVFKFGLSPAETSP